MDSSARRYPKFKERNLKNKKRSANKKKPIDYDRWAQAYWKGQLEGDLKPEEERELENLENENLKTIIEVVKAIKADREVMELIERIKGHEWVKELVEGAVLNKSLVF